MSVKLLVDTTNTTMKTITNVLALADSVTMYLQADENVLDHVLLVNTLQYTQIGVPTLVHTVN